MPTKITYYAMVDDFSSREEPAGVLRRIEDDEGRDDEAFTHEPEVGAQRLPLLLRTRQPDAEFYEISEDEANRIVERIRRSVTGQP